MKRAPAGVSWALLYNASMEFDPQDTQLAAGTVHEVRKLVEGFGKYPDIDLFKELHVRGNSVVLVTHDPHIASFAERRVELRDGLVVDPEAQAA